MAHVFGILTAIVLALSAFIAYKNKSAYESKISAKNSETEALTQSQARLANGEELLAKLPNELASVESGVEKLISDEANLKKENEGFSKQVEEKTAKISANKAQLDDVRTKTEKSGNINELASKLKLTSAELEELAQSISETEAKLANLTAQNSSTEGMVSKAKAKFDNFSSGQSLPELNTRIRSIYPNWGFVTLASGNNAGVVANSTLDVVRGGEVVAKLLVTAVESSSASATIVPDSLSADATLQVGDRVVPGMKAEKKAGN